LARPTEARRRSAYFLAPPRCARRPWPLGNPDVRLGSSLEADERPATQCERQGAPHIRSSRPGKLKNERRSSRAAVLVGVRRFNPKLYRGFVTNRGVDGEKLGYCIKTRRLAIRRLGFSRRVFVSQWPGDGDRL